MAPRLSGQPSILGGVFYVFIKSLLGIVRQKKQTYNFDPKASDPC